MQTFRNLHRGNPLGCACVTSECTEDTATVFLRRLSDRSVSAADFQSYWELKRSRPSTACKDICRAKGVSVYRSPEGDSIVERWKTTFKIRPNLGRYSCRLKFKPGAGKLDPEVGTDQHSTFYKSDTFGADSIEIIGITSLAQ
jgi:hypothetical protein